MKMLARTTGAARSWSSRVWTSTTTPAGLPAKSGE
eukprot:CAMPEP_0119494950 /NCGR_PEP_ID=MMETSP1344-20130328/18742_1 /TAXON_ID=236787 /ORGANISM="Florenciella parvula, Strain CCMP2471" /LENGTH=34 /DNA_ID= /DNA_START= /DNA_END= /DNA_ORIENTATION=